jgi:phosphoribosyl-ATP pyrophosphohydrolase/phosphoribosyl-AMP cyclohydrolase
MREDKRVDFTKLGGLVPAVIQDDRSDEVLMVGFMNHDALDRTLKTGLATFFSRSRGTLWTKGETSGNRLQVVEMLIDCDEDTLLIKVNRLGNGNVCHTGERTCFHQRFDLVRLKADTTAAGSEPGVSGFSRNPRRLKDAM